MVQSLRERPSHSLQLALVLLPVDGYLVLPKPWRHDQSWLTSEHLVTRHVTSSQAPPQHQPPPTLRECVLCFFLPRPSADLIFWGNLWAAGGDFQLFVAKIWKWIGYAAFDPLGLVLSRLIKLTLACIKVSADKTCFRTNRCFGRRKTCHQLEFRNIGRLDAKRYVACADFILKIYKTGNRNGRPSLVHCSTDNG